MGGLDRNSEPKGMRLFYCAYFLFIPQSLTTAFIYKTIHDGPSCISIWRLSGCSLWSNSIKNACSSTIISIHMMMWCHDGVAVFIAIIIIKSGHVYQHFILKFILKTDYLADHSTAKYIKYNTGILVHNIQNKRVSRLSTFVLICWILSLSPHIKRM